MVVEKHRYRLCKKHPRLFFVIYVKTNQHGILIKTGNISSAS